MMRPVLRLVEIDRVRQSDKVLRYPKMIFSTINRHLNRRFALGKRPSGAAAVNLPVYLLLAGTFLGILGCTSPYLNDLNWLLSGGSNVRAAQLIASGADISRKDDSGRTPLHNAALGSNAANIKALVDRGADVNARDKFTDTPLMCLAYRIGYANEAVTYLLDHGAHVNEVDQSGQAALALAAARRCEAKDESDQVELLSILLRAGADPKAKDRSGQMAIHLAAASGQPLPVLALIVEATPNFADVGRHGANCFTEAARGGHRETAMFFAEKGLHPQVLPPRDGYPASLPPHTVDLAPQINATAFEWYGDYLFNKGDLRQAGDHYRKSVAYWDAAVEETERVIKDYLAELPKERRRGLEQIAMATVDSVFGIKLAVTTGTGFVVVPLHPFGSLDQCKWELEALRNMELSQKAEGDETRRKLSGL